jgi:hypothetical protein
VNKTAIVSSEPNAPCTPTKQTNMKDKENVPPIITTTSLVTPTTKHSCQKNLMSVLSTVSESPITTTTRRRRRRNSPLKGESSIESGDGGNMQIGVEADTRVILTSMFMKPGRRSCGNSLQVMPDCIECETSSYGTLEFAYSNIKHAFYQLAKRNSNSVALVQFRLIEGIQLGSKQHSDFQFYWNCSKTDVKRVNKELKVFVSAVENKSKLAFEYCDTELQFDAISNRSPAIFSPTESCLVSFSNHPFFVVTLSEIELVYMERVRSSGSFDIVCVNKNYTMGVSTIESIPVEYIGAIKQWMTEKKIQFFAGSGSFRWKQVMKDVIADPEWKPWSDTNGWKNLLGIEEEEEEMIDEDEEAEDEDDDDDFQPDEEDAEDHYISDEDCETKKKTKPQRTSTLKRSRSSSPPAKSRKVAKH